MSEPLPAFESRVREALGDAQLQGALQKVQDQACAKRALALRDLPDWEAWRERVAQSRADALDHLEPLLERFTREVEKRGGTVQRAASAQEAVDHVLRIARAHGVRSVVKAKSMLSEEIGLNARLEREGIEVLETDLGEYVIQLAREHPSHIILPAIHKTKEQIRDLFSRHSGRDLPADPAALTAHAREALRPRFLAADLGISGCNLAVASTGSVVLVTNEGNARMSTTFPRVHVVLMGMERIVRDWANAAPVLTLLPRAATGQPATSYTTVITGPKRADDPDGPEKLHVVIVDNGRSEILRSPYRSVLQCIRCGACLNACPVYGRIGGHAYASVYCGPIGAVLTPLLSGFEEGQELPFASTLCGACQEVCPAKVPLADLLVRLRADLLRRYPKRAERLTFRLFGAAVAHPHIFSTGLAVAARMAASAPASLARVGPGARWAKTREVPRAAGHTFRSRWHRGKE